MSTVKFEGLIETQPKEGYSFKQSLFVPLECSMGPQISIVNSKSELYSKIAPKDYSNCKSLNLYLELGYELIIYRTNYRDEYSSIRLNETGFSYFDTKKVYTPTQGELTSVSELRGGSLSYEMDLSVINEFLFTSNSEVYDIHFYVNNFNYLVRIAHNSNEFIDADSVYEIDYMQGVDYVKSELINAIRNFIGLKISDNKVFSESNLKISCDIQGLFKVSNLKYTYDIIHRNSLTLPGLSIKSANPSSGSKITLSLSESGGEVRVVVSSYSESKVIFEEEFIGRNDINSPDYIINVLESSKLIKVISGDWNSEFVGTYTLGYTEEYDIPMNDINFKVNQSDLPKISFIVELNYFMSKKELWNDLEFDKEWNRPYEPDNPQLTEDEFIGNDYTELLNEFETVYDRYKSSIIVYINNLIKLSTKLDSAILIDELPIDTDRFNTLNNVIEIVPKIIDLTYSHTFELLLLNLSANRMQGDVIFNGRLSTEIPSNKGSGELILGQYRYVLSEVKFKFMTSEMSRSVTMTLSDYMLWYAILGFMDKIIKREMIAKPNDDIDTENLVSITTSEFSGFLRGLNVTKTGSKRKAKLDVSLELESQTKEPLILVGHLIGD